MDALSAASAAPWLSIGQPPIGQPLAARLLRATSIVLFALLALLPIVICARRASGALVEPLPATALVAVAAVLALAAIAFRRHGRAIAAHSHPLARYAPLVAPSLVLVLWSAGLLLPGTSTAGVLGFLGLLLVEEGWSWGRLGHETADRVQLGQNSLAQRGPSTSDPPARGVSQSGLALGAETEEELEQGVSQRMVRRRDETGREMIEGWVRAEFAPSQRHATAHLAICPPLAHVPECFAEPADGPPSQIKVAQVLPYGVRFEIKLDEPATEPSEVMIEFSIQERPAGE